QPAHQTPGGAGSRPDQPSPGPGPRLSMGRGNPHRPVLATHRPADPRGARAGLAHRRRSASLAQTGYPHGGGEGVSPGVTVTGFRSALRAAYLPRAAKGSGTGAAQSVSIFASSVLRPE